ncbi:MAG: hypothetical protein VZR09_11175 [Candidatus Gastranaerophilaceae bacterium]|nr:hypothetical protein [Candidatus Gastranaerophilaceae bacterium]
MNENEILEFLGNSNYRNLKNSRLRLKEKLVAYKGGKCEICGYDKCITALEFHHLNPDEKEFGIGTNDILSFEKNKKEVDKCILVCANCHREIHYRDVLLKKEEEKNKEKEVYKKILQSRDKYGNIKIRDSYKYLGDAGILEDINNNVSRKEIFKKYHINNRVFKKFLDENNIEYSKRKIIQNKPNKEELIELLKTNSKSSIGRMFGVSYNAVAKWCKKFDI